MAQELETLAVALVAETDEFKSGLDDADNIAKGWAGKLGGAVGGLIQGAVMIGATAVVAGVLSIGTAAFDVSSQVNAAAGDMAASLGLPTEEAREFAEVARKVYGNNFADSVTDAADAVGTIAKQMDLAANDPALQTMTENAFRLRDAFGTDVNESVDAAKTLMENFGLSGQEAFDMLAAGYQSGLDRSGDFLDTIGEYSVQFAEGGASAVEFFSALDTGLQGGMLGTDKAADAFKEFRVRIQDGSTLTADSLAMIGLSADEITSGLANGSITVKDAWDLVQRSLATTTDSAVQFQAGVGLIGSQFEDLGAKTILAMDLTEDWAEGGISSISSLDAQYNTFGDAAEGMWRRLVVSVSPFTDKLLELVNDAMPSVMDAFDKFDAAVGPTMEGIGSTINTVVTFVNDLWSQFGSAIDEDAIGPLEYWQDWADKNLPMVETLFNNILTAIQGFWALFGDDILHIVDNTFNTAWTIIDTVMKTIGDIITLALQLLTGDWESALTTIEGITERIWETIKTVIGNQLDNIRTVITSIDWGATGNAIIEGIANGISNGAQYIIDAAESAAQSAYEAAKNWLGISSPSTVAADGIGEPFAEGVGVGALRGLRSLAGQIDAGLAGVMGDISVPQAATDGAGGGITLNIYLQGSATYDDGRAVGAGIDDELRARGYA